MTGLLTHLEREVDRHRSVLVSQAERLAKHLTQIATQLRQDPDCTVISSLGELQSSATMFDARCASYAQAKGDLGAARSFLTEEAS